jgi:hypothetical protein
VADTTIPPVIRNAFDAPVPPDPPEVEPERDDDDRHHHHMFEVDLPVFAIYADGTRVGNGWLGHILDVWFNLATFVALGVGLWAAWSYLPTVLTVGLGAVVLTLGWVFLGAIAELERERLVQRWRGRRKASES